MKIARPIPKKTCAHPFEVMYLHSGFVTSCCPNWLNWHRWRSPLESYDATPQELWLDPNLEELRANVKSGNYDACRACPLYIDRVHHIPETSGLRFEPWKEMIEDHLKGPKLLIIADSFVCNLECWSCRKELITVDPNKEEKDKLLWRVMEEFAPNLEFVNLLGSGEVFSSARHMRFLRDFNWSDYPKLEIEIISNATLIEKQWEKIQPAHSNIKHVTISLDAATKETYENVVRKGGIWERAIGGFEYVRDWGVEGRLQATFVVREANYHEMRQFSYDMLERGAKHIMFGQLAQTHLSKQQYKEQNIFSPNHPKNHLLRKELEDPIFDDERILVCKYTE
jgi:hypothetical protein